jgi:hypothetical protein
VEADEGLARLRGLGFSEPDARTLWSHFDDAERRGKPSHGHARIDWLETQEFDPRAEPELVEDVGGFQRWHARGAVGYLVLGRVVDSALADPPEHACVVVCERTFPTGMLGHHVRRLADGGLVGVLTATSPARLASPSGGPKLAGTNPLPVRIPSAGGGDGRRRLDGRCHLGRRGDGGAAPVRRRAVRSVRAGARAAVVDSLALRGPGHGAVLLVARPESDPVPALRSAAAGVRLPGDAPRK